MKSKNIKIEKLGISKILSPLNSKQGIKFIQDSDNIIATLHKHEVDDNMNLLEYLELAGPRKKNFFDPKKTHCGIVTCGGLCPGINDIICGLVNELSQGYGVKHIEGFRYGYRGLALAETIKPVRLTSELVDSIHTTGGTILSSSRGHQNINQMIRTLLKRKINILFVIGGDGTLKGAAALAKAIKSAQLPISIIGIPKTIDNDISYVSKSFGFETAVQEAAKIIENAHTESKGAPNGVGLVKLMGRSSGFISAYTALANRNVNYCFIPEVAFTLKGRGGFLKDLDKRLKSKHHAVIVVAEGAGQDLILSDDGRIERDASGNIRLKDIGIYLKKEITDYFRTSKKEVNIKYFDPSYIIRSVPANATDSIYCVHLAQYAVHAAMSGRTNMLISHWNAHYVHVPISMAIKGRKSIDPNGRLWRTVMDATIQNSAIFNS